MIPICAIVTVRHFTLFNHGKVIATIQSYDSGELTYLNIYLSI